MKNIRIVGGPHSYELLVIDAETGDPIPGIIEKVEFESVLDGDGLTRAKLTFLNPLVDVKAVADLETPSE